MFGVCTTQTRTPTFRGLHGYEVKNMNDPMTRLSDNFFATLNARVFDFQSTGADVIRLDIGSPDLPPAPHIREALSQSAAKA